MELEALQPIMLAMTQERSVSRVMQTIVEGMTHKVGFALTRIWVRGPGDRCAQCRFADVCVDRTECLHLVASAGSSSVRPDENWGNTEGRYSRFPLGHRKVGHIAATGEPLLIHVDAETEWVDQQWARSEGILSFAGQPLIFRDEILGVLGIFCRKGVSNEAFRWLRIFADHAAIAIANARAFEEVERLTRELAAENAVLREEAFGHPDDRELVGGSITLQRLLEQVRLVAPTEATILIQGESGSGKELVARALHRHSRRADKPMVKVNCAAVPRELFESEFFGHVKGAFTGAIRDRVGRFQLADRGTLFLDEVGEIPLDLQSKLLRVLQEGEFERIGETHTRKVNVRLIAATNRDLKREVELGRFREDLYYRLSVFPVAVPPLRDRREDVPSLVSHFLRACAHRLGVPVPSVSQSEMQRLQHHDWPGNVRELAHVVERAVITARGQRADFSFVAVASPASSHRVVPPAAGNDPRHHPVATPATPVVKAERQLRDEQIANIQRALAQANGRVYGPGGAAELLGLPPSTLTSRIRRWKIEWDGK